MAVRVERDVGLTVAVMVGEGRTLDFAADQLQDDVLGIARRHRLTGDFMSTVQTKKVPGRKGNGKKVTDRFVFSDHPQVLAIEYGHFQGKKNLPDRKFVPGQFIFHQAYLNSTIAARNGDWV